MKTLIVDDENSIRQMMKFFLEKFGRTDVASNGEEAIRFFLQAWKDNEPYDLICMDIMMPQMNGKESLKNIRELEKTMGIKSSQEVKVLMITALGDPKNVFESYFKSGATGYIVKPFEREDLYKAILGLGLNTGKAGKF